MIDFLEEFFKEISYITGDIHQAFLDIKKSTTETYQPYKLENFLQDTKKLMMDYFIVTNKQHLSCDKCLHTRIVNEDDSGHRRYIIQLHIPYEKAETIEDCFKDNFKVSKIFYDCETEGCSSQSVTESWKIENTPKCLILSLKRWISNLEAETSKLSLSSTDKMSGDLKDSCKTFKNLTTIKYSESIMIKCGGKDNKYKLYSVIHHDG